MKLDVRILQSGVGIHIYVDDVSAVKQRMI